MAQSNLELKNISKNYLLDSGSHLKVLKNINLAVYPDQIVALLGPSGSGKSTCLRIMCGLLEPDRGEVLVGGKKLEGVNYNVALVFQNFALFPWETVKTNIELALLPLKLTQVEAKRRVKKAIDMVGLEGFEEAYPRELSGGMKQRVGLARAIVMERQVMLLDEPFSGLDVLTANSLRDEIINIWQAKENAVNSIVLVTHDIQETVYMAKRILVMGTNPGFIKAEIINDLPYPRDIHTPGFRRMVERVHIAIAESLIPDVPVDTVSDGPTTKVNREPPIETIPNVHISEVIGLVESLADKGGSVDIFMLSRDAGRDFGTTLYLAKSAELLDLVETPRHAIVLTDLGKKFVDSDINGRKRMLHELFGGLRIVQLTTNLVKSDESLRIPREKLEERISEWIPNENPNQLVEVLIGWGRYAEYFGYSDDTREIYLDVGQEH